MAFHGLWSYPHISSKMENDTDHTIPNLWPKLNLAKPHTFFMAANDPIDTQTAYDSIITAN